MTNRNEIDIIRDHDRVRNRKSLRQEAAKLKREHNTQYLIIMLNESATDYATRIRQKAKEQVLEMLHSKWKEKPLHGQYPKRLSDKDVDEVETSIWLSISGLKSET